MIAANLLLSTAFCNLETDAKRNSCLKLHRIHKSRLNRDVGRYQLPKAYDHLLPRLVDHDQATTCSSNLYQLCPKSSGCESSIIIADWNLSIIKRWAIIQLQEIIMYYQQWVCFFKQKLHVQKLEFIQHFTVCLSITKWLFWSQGTQIPPISAPFWEENGADLWTCNPNLWCTEAMYCSAVCACCNLVGALNFFFFFFFFGGGCVPCRFQNVGSREQIFLEKWGSWEQKKNRSRVLEFGQTWLKIPIFF